ncbi:MAG: acyltransferase family protein [Candidatus Lokiarchaeota archaeon]|nr:acyltransferase family protein [Candidatus Lokiarchaeota archaeon]
MIELQENIQKTTLQTRLFYLDKLRILLTILVILQHVTIAYGGSGGWAIKEGASDPISPIIFTLFNAINQSFFMSAFFLLAGYFTPRSYEIKDPLKFIKDRLIRLGIPLALFILIIQPINMYILMNFAVDSSESWSFLEVLQYQYTHFRLQFGHLWFILLLLIFVGIYIVFRVLTARYFPQKSIHMFRDKFPPNRVLFLCIALLSFLTFAVRLVFPVDEWFFFVQFAHIIHYTFYFYCGVLAYRGDWFSRISSSHARHWGIISLITILLSPVILLLGGALESGNYDVFKGGMTWQALTYAICESILLIGIPIWLIYMFRERLTHHGRVSKALAANVYTVYIIHQPVLIAFNVAFLYIAIPTVVKFIIVSLITVPVCFLLSHFIFRKIPYAKRVLG